MHWPCYHPIPGNLVAPLTLPALRAPSFEHRRRPGACAGPAVAVAVAGIQTPKVAEKRTELLVDADCCDNVEMIRCAIRDWAQV